LQASPLGYGRREPASRYENRIGPIIVFMGELDIEDDEEQIAEKLLLPKKGKSRIDQRRRQLAHLVAQNKKYIYK